LDCNPLSANAWTIELLQWTRAGAARWGEELQLTKWSESRKPVFSYQPKQGWRGAGFAAEALQNLWNNVVIFSTPFRDLLTNRHQSHPKDKLAKLQQKVNGNGAL
jgi:hypothetical protein